MIQTLDSIIRMLGFLDLDVGDPKLTRFGDHQVPSIESAEQQAMDSAAAAVVVAYDSSNASSAAAAAHHQHVSNGHAYPHHHSANGGYGMMNPAVAVGSSLSGRSKLGNTLASTIAEAGTVVGGQSLGLGIADGGCSCALFKISSMSPQSAKSTPFWLATPGWNSSWSLAETRYEEQRRLVWSSLTLAAGFVSYCNSMGVPPIDLAITKPWMVRPLLCCTRWLIDADLTVF